MARPRGAARREAASGAVVNLPAAALSALVAVTAPVAGTASAPRCEDVSSIGAATMEADGTLSLRLRSPDGAEGVLVYRPTDERYRSILDHLGPMRPGDSRPVKPFC